MTGCKPTAAYKKANLLLHDFFLHRFRHVHFSFRKGETGSMLMCFYFDIMIHTHGKCMSADRWSIWNKEFTHDQARKVCSILHAGIFL